jgi:hypothetical protein
MSGRRDATGRRCCGDTQRTGSRAGVVARQVVAKHSMAEVEPVWPQDEVAAHGVVDDESRDEPRDVPRHPDAQQRQSSRRRAVR